MSFYIISRYLLIAWIACFSFTSLAMDGSTTITDSSTSPPGSPKKSSSSQSSPQKASSSSSTISKARGSFSRSMSQARMPRKNVEGRRSCALSAPVVMRSAETMKPKFSERQQNVINVALSLIKEPVNLEALKFEEDMLYDYLLEFTKDTEIQEIAINQVRSEIENLDNKDQPSKGKDPARIFFKNYENDSEDAIKRRVALALKKYKSDQLPSHGAFLKLEELSKELGINLSKTMWKKLPKKPIPNFSLKKIDSREIAKALTKSLSELRSSINEAMIDIEDPHLKMLIEMNNKIQDFFVIKFKNKKTKKKIELLYRKLYDSGEIMMEEGNLWGAMIVFSALSSRDVERLFLSKEKRPKFIESFPLLNESRRSFFLTAYNTLLQKLFAPLNAKPNYLLSPLYLPPLFDTIKEIEKDDPEDARQIIANLRVIFAAEQLKCDYKIAKSEKSLDLFFSQTLVYAPGLVEGLMQTPDEIKNTDLPKDPKAWNYLQTAQFFHAHKLYGTWKRLAEVGYGKWNSIRILLGNGENNIIKTKMLARLLGIEEELAKNILDATFPQIQDVIFDSVVCYNPQPFLRYKKNKSDDNFFESSSDNLKICNIFKSAAPVQDNQEIKKIIQVPEIQKKFPGAASDCKIMRIKKWSELEKFVFEMSELKSGQADKVLAILVSLKINNGSDLMEQVTNMAKARVLELKQESASPTEINKINPEHVLYKPRVAFLHFFKSNDLNDDTAQILTERICMGLYS